MLYFFVVWLITIVGGLFFCLFGSMISSIAGSSTVTFLLVTGLIAVAATVLRLIVVQLESMEKELQSQSQQLRRIEERLEQWEKGNSDQEIM